MKNLIQKLRTFKKAESGAVTVDWVVLTAAVVILAGGIATVTSGSGATSVFSKLNTKISAMLD